MGASIGLDRPGPVVVDRVIGRSAVCRVAATRGSRSLGASVCLDRIVRLDSEDRQTLATHRNDGPWRADLLQGPIVG